MPVIEAKLIEGVMTKERKTQLIEKLTDAVVAVAGERIRPFVYVLVEETRDGEWGIGGQPMTAAKVHEVARSGKAATG